MRKVRVYITEDYPVFDVLDSGTFGDEIELTDEEYADIREQSVIV